MLELTGRLSDIDLAIGTEFVLVSSQGIAQFAE